MPSATASTTLVIFSVSTSKKGSPFRMVSPFADRNHWLILTLFHRQAPFGHGHIQRHFDPPPVVGIRKLFKFEGLKENSYNFY